MVIADSSVWIDFQRDPDSQVGRELDRLLADGEVIMVGPVLTEVLQGSRSDSDFELLVDALSNLSFLESTQQMWEEAGKLNYLLKLEGRVLAMSDLMIATLALEHDIPVYSLNGDFDRVPGLQRHWPSRSEST